MDGTESQEIVVDFGKICRLCLSEEGVMISLYSTDSILGETSKSIPERIMELMSIKVMKDDGFPPWICHNCLSQVDKFSEFFDMCKTSQATLNNSYIAALSEAGINLDTLKDGGDICNFPEKNSENEQTNVFYQKDGEINSEADGAENNEFKETDTNFCSDCSKVFLNGDEFFIHRVSVHHDDLVIESGKAEQENSITYLWTCDTCGAKFRSRNAIITHIRFKHLKADSDFQPKKLMFCKYCGLSFSRKNLGRHLEVVHRMTRNIESEEKDIGSFDCRICYRPFMKHSSLRVHIEKFHADYLEMMSEIENCEIVWNCNECDSVFLEEVYLMQHYGSKHSKYPVEVDALRTLKDKNLICGCGVINSNFFDASLHAIFYHSIEKLGDGKVGCPACEKVFIKVEDLKIHLISFHWFTSMSYENECVFCNFSFGTNDELCIHLNTNHNINFEKNSLEEKFKKKRGDDIEEISEEEKIEKMKNMAKADNSQDFLVSENDRDCLKSKIESQKPEENSQFSHICELCGKRYKSENHLKRHVSEYHNTMLPTKCPLCPKVFPRKMNLHNHYKRRHLKEVKKFVCSYCGQSLKGKVSLKSHEDRLHRNIRSYKCTECPEAFTTRSILRKHAQRHLSERPMLQCQYCEKKFSTISGIERHVKKHEGVKEFTCDLSMCGKSFYTKSELKRHIKFHTRDFRHVCSICNHKFMSPGELKKHSTKHTGERPFKCHLCSCAYARRDDKVKHLKRVHNLKVKRIYGKPLKKYTDEDTELVDTIVIDESCNENLTENNDVYSTVNVSEVI